MLAALGWIGPSTDGHRSHLASAGRRRLGHRRHRLTPAAPTGLVPLQLDSAVSARTCRCHCAQHCAPVPVRTNTPAGTVSFLVLLWSPGDYSAERPARENPHGNVESCPPERHCQVGEPGRWGGAGSTIVTAAGSSYKGFRSPPEIISGCVWLYHRFPLSFRDVQELMLERGVDVSCETIRAGCDRFGQEYAN